MVNEILTLDRLDIDCYGVISEVNCEGNVLRRFLDLGLIKGTKICPVYSNASKDLVAYFFRGTVIALRKDDAKNIIIHKVEAV